MRVLFVLANYYPYVGGAERAFKCIAEGLAHNGHSIRVLTTHIPGTSLYEVINGVEIKRVRVLKFAKQYMFTFYSLPVAIKEAKSYDLIHTCSNYGGLAGYLAARITRRPVVFTCHEVLGKRWYFVEQNIVKAFVLRYIENTIVKLPYERYLAVSIATLRDLLSNGIKPEHASYIYHGIDSLFYAKRSQFDNGKLRSLCGVDENDFLYVYFGRPGTTKGINYLLNAVPFIRENIPNSHLALILASEPHDQYLQICRIIEDLGIKRYVHLIPSASNINQLISYLLNANCIVVPSLTEGFGFTTAEACALEVPVVATKTGSIPEVVSGRHILVEPASEKALADGVIRAWRGQYDDWIAPKKFTWAEAIAKHEKCYEELLA